MKVLAGVLLFATMMIAQSSQFAVASVKPSLKEARGVRVNGGPGTSDPTRLTCENCSLSMLVMMAYEVRPYQFSAPAWMDTARYEVVAQIPPDAKQAAVPTHAAEALGGPVRVASAPSKAGDEYFTH